MIETRHEHRSRPCACPRPRRTNPGRSPSQPSLPTTAARSKGSVRTNACPSRYNGGQEVYTHPGLRGGARPLGLFCSGLVPDHVCSRICSTARGDDEDQQSSGSDAGCLWCEPSTWPGGKRSRWLVHTGRSSITVRMSLPRGVSGAAVPLSPMPGVTLCLPSPISGWLKW